MFNVTGDNFMIADISQLENLRLTTVQLPRVSMKMVY